MGSAAAFIGGVANIYTRIYSHQWAGLVCTCVRAFPQWGSSAEGARATIRLTAAALGEGSNNNNNSTSYSLTHLEKVIVIPSWILMNLLVVIQY